MTSWGVMAPRCVRRSAVYCQSPATAESKACSPVGRRLLRSNQTLEAHSTNRGGHGRVTDRQCQPRSDRPPGSVVSKILRHLGLPSDPVRCDPARAPPDQDAMDWAS